MGRRILVQRRGKGTQNFRSPSNKKVGEVKHHPLTGSQTLEGKILDFVHEGGRGHPLARVRYSDGTEGMWLPPEGIFVGDSFKIGDKTDLTVGNTMTLEFIPEGALVYNIEIRPGDGGKFVRASGTAATIMTRTERGVVLELPSGKRITFNQKSRATVGVVAGGGKITKPFLKAGNKMFQERTGPKVWPTVKAGKMNACSHPFGGGRKKRPGKATTTSRNAPPGRKVGLIAARRTGLKKK